MNTDNLYEELLSLTKEGDAFYFKDYDNYRVFNYRLASYTDFCKPSALEARGIMFYMGGEVPVLVCRPFKKFFNLNETPFTMGLDLSKVKKFAAKEDGSIITSFIDQETGKLRLKSKQDLYSEQAKMAEEVINQKEYQYLRIDTYKATHFCGLTVMFELVSPANRIVLEYPKTKLVVIGLRNMDTGELCEEEDVLEFPDLKKHWVHEETHAFPEKFVESIPDMTGIEGYVLTMEDGQQVKVKTKWYQALHHLKDSVDSVKRLFEAIIDERVDDVKAMFATDAFTINRIAEMERKVIPTFNALVSKVEAFYEENKTATRKDYAVKGQQELGNLFNLAMGKYLHNLGIKDPPDYKEYAKKYREELFGLKEVEPTEE